MNRPPDATPDKRKGGDSMRVLHTSDWHLGKRLFGRERQNEHERFARWLITTLEQNTVGLLLVSGDVFDSATPSVWAQSLYVRTLLDARQKCSVVVTAGNHDSAALLDMTRPLLESLGIVVRGTPSPDPVDDLVEVRCPGEQTALVAACPFLRERDLVLTTSLDDPDGRRAETSRKITERFAALYDRACERRAELGGQVPLLAMGHLFVAGARSSEDDGMRSLSVGGLDALPAAGLPPFDYWALGHIHRPQSLTRESVRYSGAPLQLGFGEAEIEKSVTLIDLEPSGTLRDVTEMPVPRWRKLVRMKGSTEELEARLASWNGQDDQPVWAQLEFTDPSAGRDLWHRFGELSAGRGIEILRLIVPDRLVGLSVSQEAVELNELSHLEVFQRLLEARQVPPDRRGLLEEVFRQAAADMESRVAAEGGVDF